MKNRIKVSFFIYFVCFSLSIIKSADHIKQSHGLSLRVAVIMKDMSKAEKALSDGADRDTYNSNGFTPLLIAARDNSHQIASLLITEKATINFQANNKTTALHMAARYSSKEVIEVLLAAGADASLKDISLKTPLDYAFESESIENISLLLSKVFE